MTAVGELLLILGLLVSAHCEVRARDPEVEEEEEDQGPELSGGAGGGGGGWEPGQAGAHHGGLGVGLPNHRADGQGGLGVSAQGHEHQPQGYQPEETAPPAGEGGNYPLRTGNWCAFVQKKKVTIAVSCGTERYTIKSQSPCPRGTPECLLVMYKLSTRPVYRQKEKIFTALLWRCCPGHGGKHCEEGVADGQMPEDREPSEFGSAQPAIKDLRAPGAQASAQLQPGDPNQEQNDYQLSGSPFYHPSPHVGDYNDTHPDPGVQSPTYPDPHHDRAHGSHSPHHHTHHPQPHAQQQDYHSRGSAVSELDAEALPYPDIPSALPLPHMMALVMSQLQPFLEGYNRTLERLSTKVDGLARDVAQLQSNQWGGVHEAEAFAGTAETAEERFDAKLDETFQNIDEVRRMLDGHRAEMGDRLHSQQVMLHYNLTSFKTDIDMKLKRNQKMLQAALQAMNATLTEVKEEQEQLSEELQRRSGDDLRGTTTPPPLQPPTEALQLPNNSALWKAVELLDNKVVQNTVKVNAMVEDLEITAGDIQGLRRDIEDQGQRITQTGRNSQIQFMETGLEVEAAKVTVLNRVNELAGNLSMQTQRLQEVESDVDYVFSVLYKSANTSGDCDCKSLKADIVHLEQGLESVSELANDNRLALDATSEDGIDHWGQPGDLEPAVRDLQQGLQQVKESLAFEQERTRTLYQNVTHLSNSVAGSQEEMTRLQENDQRLAEQMKHLGSSFKSLIKDALRHNDVLEVLLGEEVIEFVKVKDRGSSYSIPVLQEKIHHIQEEINKQNVSIKALLRESQGYEEDTPAADQPSSHLPDWLNGFKRSDGDQRREHQLLHPGQSNIDYSDGGDLWMLEKAVEDLGVKVRRLEGRPCPTNCNSSSHLDAPSSGSDDKLQAEVTWLRRGLEDHLRVFKNVFSNTDNLAKSDATLDMDKLWALVTRKEGKREKKKDMERRRGRKEGPNGRSTLRSRRDIADIPALPKISNNPLLFLASSLHMVEGGGQLVFEASLNQADVYSKTGSFTAPLSGTYLFVLTLDLKPGPTKVGMRRASGVFAALHSETATERGPVTRVCLLDLQKGEEIHVELKEGAMVNSRDNILAGYLLHQST